MFPTWPAKSEMAKRPKKKDVEHSPQAPEGGAMFAKLVSVLRWERWVNWVSCRFIQTKKIRVLSSVFVYTDTVYCLFKGIIPLSVEYMKPSLLVFV